MVGISMNISFLLFLELLFLCGLPLFSCYSTVMTYHAGIKNCQCLFCVVTLVQVEMLLKMCSFVSATATWERQRQLPGPIENDLLDSDEE